jgi:hypothetical protein
MHSVSLSFKKFGFSFKSNLNTIKASKIYQSLWKKKKNLKHYYLKGNRLRLYDKLKILKFKTPDVCPKKLFD